MELDSLLENDDRYKLFIYQLLQLSHNSAYSVNELRNQIELSEFKFNKLIEGLIKDTKELKSTIEVDDNKYIVSDDLSSEDYQILRLMYFKASVAANFLVKVGLFENLTTSEFAEVNYMSSSSVYNLQTDINDLLSELNLKVKSSKIIGPEKEVRSFYFKLLFEYFGGIESPFPKRTAESIENYLAEIEIVNPSKVKMAQLKILLGIQICRIRNEHDINELTNIPIVELSNKKKFFNDNELQYLSLYLILNRLVDIDVKEVQDKIEATELEQRFTSLLEDKLHASKLESYRELSSKISIISQRWHNFYLTSTTFISISQFRFLEQSYPFLHKLVHEFVEKLNRVDDRKLSNTDKLSLYYDFMFCLLSFKEIQNFENAVKVVVDFSGGDNYNSFIKENIAYFRYLNIQIVDSLSDDIDIYISDFSNSDINSIQMIWKSPPIDSDWAQFADTVIMLKGNRNE
ncbi:helix-turn-helix domain-containing protein [Lactobacillus sp. YT155]|uniref:helix-turn-helix domain-containing protein n=1 Tax=Lactobacillus sp. YT155 TaxID=3060955 RepID=UPI0026602F19|nr:helix-turn-helix domain-containing protein [Lactobacillus sp. YT155]MDO1605888.1 helix-turn-helix domain-containing protein [Lactobacillus sp. YT155]